MRLLSSKCRTVAEVLLTLAVLAYVAFDLVDRSGKPASEPIALSLQAKAAETLPLPSANTLVAPNRVRPQYNTSNMLLVCGNTVAPALPWVIGASAPLQSLVFSGTCATNPVVLGAGNTSYGAVSVLAGSGIVLDNIAPTVLTGGCGPLTMQATSYVEAIIPATFTRNPYVAQTMVLLVAKGAPCPSFTGISFNITTCPYDAAYASVGQYNCYLTSSTTSTSCTLSLSVVGPLTMSAGVFLQIVMARDCNTLSQADFKLIIQTATGVPADAIVVSYWQCGSIVTIITVMGSSTAQALNALNTIYLSALSGTLRSMLSVVSVGIVSYSSPALNYSYTTITMRYPYRYPYTLPVLVPYSSSNPGLLALLTLLIIPVAVGLALLFWCACRPQKPVCPPCPPCVPMCCPAPAPVCCEAMFQPVACEPLCSPMCAAPGAPFVANTSF